MANSENKIRLSQKTSPSRQKTTSQKTITFTRKYKTPIFNFYNFKSIFLLFFVKPFALKKFKEL